MVVCADSAKNRWDDSCGTPTGNSWTTSSADLVHMAQVVSSAVRSATTALLEADIHLG